MKSVEFIKVGMENFCGFKSLMEYEFENKKLTLISGQNGAGKSTVFECLCYVLYGNTPKGLSGDDVVNNEVGKNCSTYLTFKIGDDLYKAERYRKHYKHTDSAYLSKNEEKPYKKGAKEVTEECTKLLLPQKLLVNTILFGQKVKTFFTDLTDSEQKDIFRKVLQLDDYALYLKEATTRLKDLNDKLLELQNKTSVGNQMISQTVSQIEQYKEEQVKFEKIKAEDIERYKNEAAELTLQYETLERTIKVLFHPNMSSELENLDKELTDTLLKIKEIEKNFESEKVQVEREKENRLADFDQTYSKSFNEFTEEKNSKAEWENKKFYSKSNELTSSITKLGTEIEGWKKRYKVLTDNFKQITIEIKQIEDGLNGEEVICFACNQVVGQDKVKHLKHMVEEKRRSLDLVNGEMRKLTGDIQSFEIANNESSIELQKLTEESHAQLVLITTEFNNKVQDLKDRFKIAKDKLIELADLKIASISGSYSENKSELVSKYQDLKDKKDVLGKELVKKNELDEKLKRVQSDITTNKRLLEEVEKRTFNMEVLKTMMLKLKQLKIDVDKISEDKEELSKVVRSLEFWKEGFSNSGIPSMLIDESIPFMNSRIKHYLELLGGRYMVSFDTLSETKSGESRDKIKIHVLDTVTKSNDRKKFSGGQTRMVDVATIFTLHDLQSVVQDMKINIILLDEIFDALDEVNVGYVSRLLRILSKEKSITVISHTNIDVIECDEHLRL